LKAVRRRKVQRGNSSIVARLLSVAVEREGIKGLRDSALVLTLHDSGLRRAEVATLRVGDVDLEGRVAQVVGKGRQGEREAVDLSEPAAVAIRAYLGARGSLLPDAPLFCNADRAGKGTGGLSADGIRVVLAVLSRRAGLTQAVAPHDLRRQGAYALAKAGADAEMLRRWGRWSDYRVAARYVGEVEERGRAAVDLLAGLRQAVG
jgi:site-specific recombinase XerD